MPVHSILSPLLEQLSDHLKSHQLWSDEAPTTEQLASTQPFAVDTMRIEQWLQFVFIPKLTLLVASHATLPMKISVLPMVEHSFSQRGIDAPLIMSTIAKIDQLLSQQNHA